MIKLSEIEERCAKATPGPWHEEPETYEEQWAIVGKKHDVFSCAYNHSKPDDNDISFIIHSRTDLPTLCCIVRAYKRAYADLMSGNAEHINRGMDRMAELDREIAL